MKRKVIVDTDPGIDDLLALAMVNALSDYEILAFSTVHGNVSLDYTTRNAALISDLLNMDIPIIKGASSPLYYDKKEVSPVHGKDGLANLYDHYRNQVDVKNKIMESNKLDEMILNSNEKITIVALGPLTNIARLLLENEGIEEKIQEIHIMGGGLTFGNINELAEFNFYSDSQAANVVLQSSIPVILSPLDLTHKIYFTESEFDTLDDHNLKLEFIKESVKFYMSLDPYMHDVCSVLTLDRPDLFEFEDVDVDVIVGNNKADGLSYAMWQKPQYSIKVATTNKREEIVDYIFKTLNDKYSK